MATIDKATLDAVRSTKRELHAKESHKRQLARNTARKRAAIAVTQSRQQAHVAVVQARGESASNLAAQRAQIRTVAHQQARSEETSDRNRAAVGSVVSSASSSDSGNLIMTTIFVMFGLIVIYILVHNPGPTTGWLGGLGNALHALSSNTPLFTTTAKVA